MKNIYLLICFWACFASCTTTKIQMGKVPEKKAPFLMLKSGKKVEGAEITVRNLKIELNNTKYNKKEIAFYSDGDNTFANIGKRTFSILSTSGDINVYTHTTRSTSSDFVGTSPASPSGWHTSSHTSVSYYLQKGEFGKLEPMNYTSASKFIPHNEPAYRYLSHFHDNRAKNRIVGWCGLGAFVGGVGLIAGGGNGAPAGGALLLGGITSLVTVAILNQFNHLNIKRAIAKHNGMNLGN